MAAGVVVAAGGGAANAAPISPGNVVVYRVGPSAGGLLNTGAEVFVDEYTPAGALVQSIPLNSVGAAPKLVASGTATSEGLLTVSPSGQFVVITGYNSTIPAAAALPGSAGAAVNRSVGVIPINTGVPGISLFPDFAGGNNPRSAATNNGVNLWMTGGTGGVRYATFGAGVSTQINAPATLGNLRQVNIFSGQLFASTQSGAGGNTISLGTVGAGLPTVPPAAFAVLPGPAPINALPAAGSSSRFAFSLVDATPLVAGDDVLYIADDEVGLSKFSLVGGAWVLNGVVGGNADDFRGVSAITVPGGAIAVFATRRGGSGAAGGGELVRLDDLAGYNGAFIAAPVSLSVAPANVAFRGVGVIPGGACCFATGCTLVTAPNACNGTFLGNGSTCDQCPPQGGACCLPSGLCSITPTQTVCLSQGGVYQGDGVLCIPDPCPAPELGACCFPDGVCQIRLAVNCDIAGGLWLGAGTGCNPNPCRGACCPNDGACTITAPGQCVGEFQGIGTTCQPDPCAVVISGACCRPDGTCVQVPTAGECPSPSVYLGDGTVCGVDPCPITFGACCTPNQTCVQTSEAQCLQGGGTFYPAQSCANTNCDQGACCRPDGTCGIFTVPAQCVQGGGVFQGFGTVCVPNPCPTPQDGACCRPDGTCVLVTSPTACNGVFLGFGSVCGPETCKGACCLPDGSCFTAPPIGCTAGNFQGIGTTCLPNPCPQPSGACCLPDGTCLQVPGPAACNGTFIGFGSTCATVVCRGACCFPDGTCAVTAPAQCAGDFQGIGTACVPSPCPVVTVTCCNQQTGACAIRVGPCLIGEAQIATGPCLPNPCPQPAGVCCAGAACFVIPQAQCGNLPFSQFVITALTCPGTPTQPCCRADFNKSGVITVQDLFDFLQAYFNNSPLADANASGTLTVQDLFDFLQYYFQGGCP